MKKIILLLAVLAVFPLAGCGSMLERSYASVTPHTQFSDESENEAILRAENYPGLVGALLHRVEQGQENGVVRLYQYASLTGTAASDVDQACLEVTQEDPLGTYAVDYIKYDVKPTAAYYQVEVKLAYQIPPEELAQVISVTGSTAVEQELRELLPAQPEKVLFRIGYFTQEDSAETLRQAVWEAYEAQLSHPARLLEVEVKLYPDAGQQRVAELLLTWEESDRPNQQTMGKILGNLKN
ncbi:MAG: hypothetical protein SOY17_05340 [Evtepia sp.]|nr:hypothetical protein [Evtepia sp.]